MHPLIQSFIHPCNHAYIHATIYPSMAIHVNILTALVSGNRIQLAGLVCKAIHPFTRSCVKGPGSSAMSSLLCMIPSGCSQTVCSSA